MAKGMLIERKETTQRQTKNKVRKVLQTLQISANEKDLIENMINPDDKDLPHKELKNVEKSKLTEKENVPAVRRSKRKNATASTVNYAEVPEVPKAAKSTKGVSKSKKTTKSKKGNSNAGKKNEQTKLNQTKIQFTPVAAITPLKENKDEFQTDNHEKLITSTTEVTEDSGFDPNSGIVDESPKNSTAIINSPDVKTSVIPYDETSILTSDIAPTRYWQDLAEQRRIALEKALHENELLHDQLTVLETENSQLKELVREAENIVRVIKGVID